MREEESMENSKDSMNKERKARTSLAICLLKGEERGEGGVAGVSRGYGNRRRMCTLTGIRAWRS